MRVMILAVLVAIVPGVAFAESADGVWKTEAGEDGGYLEVTIGPCESDATKTCGKITNAFGDDGADPNYKYMGRVMVKDMESTDGIQYSGGTIWDPEKDKTYKSKMHCKGDDLDVKGCISFFCSGQDWKRVK